MTDLKLCKIQIRLSAEEKHDWEIAAFRANQSLSDYIRDAVEFRAEVNQVAEESS